MGESEDAQRGAGPAAEGPRGRLADAQRDAGFAAGDPRGRLADVRRDVGPVAVRILDIRLITQQDADLVAHVLPERYVRAEGFYFPEDRLRCIGAGKLLIQHVGISCENQLVIDEHGKPAAPGLAHFNLSHSGNYVIAGTADCPVGVDVEHMEQRHLKVAKRVFTQDEMRWLEQDELLRFHVLWTQKEAAMKLDGRGLGIDPRTFEMSPLGLSSATVVGGKKMSVASFVHDDCVVSVATYAER